MASNTVIHSKMGIVDATGKVCQFCPKASGLDIIVAGNGHSGNTIQELSDSLAKIAFDKTFTGISDGSSSSTAKTYSTNKLNNLVNNTLTKGTNLDTYYNNGASKIVTKIKALGVQPASNSPSDISTAIDQLATNYYNDGYSEGSTSAQQGSAKQHHIKAGKTYSSSEGIGLEGTMAVEDVFNRKLSFNDEVTLEDTVILSGSKFRTDSIETVSISREISISTTGDSDNVITVQDSIPIEASGTPTVLGCYVNRFSGNIFYKSFSSASSEAAVLSNNELDINVVSVSSTSIGVEYKATVRNVKSGLLRFTFDLVYVY